jgi:hypothetical protein
MTIVGIATKGVGTELTSTEINTIDSNTEAALDKRAGQTDTLESVVSCSGAGRLISTRTAGADANTTYALSSGIAIIDASSGLSAGREYTLSITGAIAGDRVVILGGAQNVTVKDGFDSSTMLIVGTSATAQHPAAEFVFNGTRWRTSFNHAVGAGAFLATPSSANLAALVTDETGTGALVFANSPTFAGTTVHSGTGSTTTNNAKGTVNDANPVNVQTTDATVTTLDSFTLASGTAVTVSWLVAAIRSDSTQGAGYSVMASFRNNGGAVAQIGATQVQSLEDNSAWAATADNSGTTIRLRVTGAAGVTIQWTAVLTRLSVIP